MKIKYPGNFESFKGKYLNEEEINNLLQDGLNDKAISIRTGDTLITFGLEYDPDMLEWVVTDNITIYQQIASLDWDLYTQYKEESWNTQGE